MHRIQVFFLSLTLASSLSVVEQSAAQPGPLTQKLNAGEQVLEFDWPALRIGTGEYMEGPTGVTVFRFGVRGKVAMDVRGGGPGTVNAAYVDIGYDLMELDSIVFAGGSWYGLEATTAVATALKDEGLRSGDVYSSIAMSIGSIIYDFGGRRLNEIYPDKALAQAAWRTARAGNFPLGAQGAGRSVKSGGYFGCNAFSGQGGAFKQIGDLKIAVFVVANSYGVITDRQGQVAACYPDPQWSKKGALLTSDLMGQEPALLPVKKAQRENTTISLVVVNQPMSAVELKRLAVQVHSSMGRAIQPFATIVDGDVLYAVSTGELDAPVLAPPTLGVVASELMWDALLASVPEQPTVGSAPPRTTPLVAVNRVSGQYRFSDTVSITVKKQGGRVLAKAVAARPAFSIPKDKFVELKPMSDGDYMVPGRYPMVLRFEDSETVVLNPGHWQQLGRRVK